MPPRMKLSKATSKTMQNENIIKHMIRNEKELVSWRRSGQANATSISVIPTQAGSGREQWAQLTLNKGAV